ncbi:fibrinogen-like protein A isoform X1 [Physella acuta]|uniref:fibrinogen-like protein A isoform X1 n=1 Tax=Physella acuta TaxID=109671 RepID=UPI0027DD0A2B|nr:fibrinogen-like protein A isoform X1 [Physella acuta]
MGTLKMSAGVFVLVLALNLFLGSGVFATDLTSMSDALSDILIKLQAMHGTINENRNKLQSIPSKLQDLKETVQENQNKLQAIPSKFEYLTESLQDNHIKLETIEGTVQDNQNRLLAIPNKLQTLQETVQHNKKLLHELEMIFPIPIEICKINMKRPFFNKYLAIDGEKLALCDTETDGGGWIVIQRRIKGDVNFTRTWNDYKNGFGSTSGDFWIGNDVISKLTDLGYNELRFDMKYKGKDYYAVYRDFKVENEAAKYKMSNTSFSGGNVGDEFSQHSGDKFTTFDSDNDEWSDGNCAVDWSSGGWWYKACHGVNVNGEWASLVSKKGIHWHSITDTSVSLDFVEMKLRRM